MFSVLNEYNLLWEASYQEQKRLGYFKKKKVYPRNLQRTHKKSTGYLTAETLQAEKTMHLVTFISNSLLESNLESMSLT